MNYGLAYGLSAFGLGQQLRIDPGEARGLMDEYFETFGGVRDYLGGVVDEARRTGFTETLWGRRRYLPDLTSDNRQRREMAERMALNAPIQGSAADLIKVAMLHVDAAIREAGLALADAAPGARRARLRGRAGRARRARGGRTPRDGRRRRPRRAARRLGRHRPQLARRGALSRERAEVEPARVRLARRPGGADRFIRRSPAGGPGRSGDQEQTTRRVDGEHDGEQARRWCAPSGRARRSRQARPR